MYVGYYDPDKKKTSVEKLSDAAARYRRRWNREPRIALVNAADACSLDGIDVRVVGHVAPNVYLVGEELESETV